MSPLAIRLLLLPAFTLSLVYCCPALRAASAALPWSSSPLPAACLASSFIFNVASPPFFTIASPSSSFLPIPASSSLPAPSSSPLPALLPFGHASSFCFRQDAVNHFAQHWRSAFGARLLADCHFLLLCPASLLAHCQLLLLLLLLLLVLLLCPASLHEVHAKQEVSGAAGEGPGCSSSSRQSVWPRAGRPCGKPVCRYGLGSGSRVLKLGSLAGRLSADAPLHQHSCQTAWT